MIIFSERLLKSGWQGYLSLSPRARPRVDHNGDQVSTRSIPTAPSASVSRSTPRHERANREAAPFRLGGSIAKNCILGGASNNARPSHRRRLARPQLRWLPQGYPKIGRSPRHFSKCLILLVEPSGIEPPRISSARPARGRVIAWSSRSAGALGRQDAQPTRNAPTARGRSRGGYLLRVRGKAQLKLPQDGGHSGSRQDNGERHIRFQRSALPACALRS